MKNSRLFVTAGALLLGAIGVFATKPAKKFTTFQVTFTGTGITVATNGISANNTNYTTATTSGKKLQLKTTNGAVISTLQTATFFAPVYIK